MFTILWFVVLCTSVGAHEHELTNDEIRAIVEDSIYKQYANDILSSSGAYSDESTESSSENSREWSTTKATSPAHEVSQPEDSAESAENSEWPTTETTSHNYEASQHNDFEEYALADQPHAGEGDSIRIGSLRGIPGVHFPDYTDIPLTSFTCSDKVHIPGFYADMETGCQVFHVCWPHRRESFLCPIGTTFNQAILTCDYWYSCNCSLASHFYDVNAPSPHAGGDYKRNPNVDSILDVLQKGSPKPTTKYEGSTEGVSKSYGTDLSRILKFLPVKSKVVIYEHATESKTKIIAEASVGKQSEHDLEPGYIPIKPKYTSTPPPQRTVTAAPVTPKYTSAPPPTQRTATPAPEGVTPTIKPKSTHVIDPINRIIDEVFHIIKKIVGEGGLIPILKQKEDYKRTRKQAPVLKTLPLPTLNPRFIIKPVPTQKANTVTMNSQYKPIVKKTKDHDFKVSPLTKKALVENYLRLFKLRH